MHIAYFCQILNWSTRIKSYDLFYSPVNLKAPTPPIFLNLQVKESVQYSIFIRIRLFAHAAVHVSRLA